MIIKKVETEKELNDAFHIRKLVFVQEQNVPIELELDQYDDEAVHFIVYEHEKAIGAGRLRKLQNGSKVERVCIAKSHRHLGIGASLMQKIEQTAKELEWQPLHLNAQIKAVPFYERLGYSPCSQVFYEANIPHVAMIKK